MRLLLCSLVCLCGVARAEGPVAERGVEAPVVIVPGFMGFDHLPAFGGYFESVTVALEARGDRVYIVRSPPVASSAVRSRAFIDTLAKALKETGAPQAVVVAHSQGGLDVRVALDDPRVAAQVGAVVTLSTPHHGSAVAVFATTLVPDATVDGVLDVVQASWQEAEFVPFAERAHADSRASLYDLSAGAPSFNLLRPTSPVPFFSVAGATNVVLDTIPVCHTGVWAPPHVADVPAPDIFFPRMAHRLVNEHGATDGVTTTTSAVFGTFLGCVPIDHGDWHGWNKAARTSAPALDERVVVLHLVDGLRAAAAARQNGDDSTVAMVVGIAPLIRFMAITMPTDR